MNPTGYKIIMNPPMVPNEPNGLQNYHEPTHGYKIIDELESKQALDIIISLKS